MLRVIKSIFLVSNNLYLHSTLYIAIWFLFIKHVLHAGMLVILSKYYFTYKLYMTYILLQLMMQVIVNQSQLSLEGQLM